MKSYLLVTGDFARTGGMDRANFALANYLAQRGLVHLVAHRVAPELLTQANVTFHRVPKVANSYLLSSPLLDQAGRSQAQRLTRAGGRVLVNGGNCQWGDLNWVHYVHKAYRPESQTGRLRQIKGAISHQLSLTAERRALQSARVIIANSERTKQDLIDKLSIRPQQVHTVYYGVDPHSFYPVTPQERAELRHQLGWSAEKPIVVFIGALGDRRKGFDTLFAAWQRLCIDPTWDADLVAIGAGAELPLWQRRAAEAGIASRIRFLGFRPDIPDLLRAADCLVAPTRYEAYGLGVHEALCCGLPALVSSTAGVAERYPSDLSDLLIPDPEDAVNLVARLCYWRETTDKYCKLVNSFSEQLRSYTWDDMAKSILEKIEQCELNLSSVSNTR
jgi:glycosyltransferase involved in cell wall biosynthesis